MAVKLKTGRSATLYHSPSVHYLYRRFNYNDYDPSATQLGKAYVGVLPDKCLPLETYVRVNSSCSAADMRIYTGGLCPVQPKTVIIKHSLRCYQWGKAA